MEENKKAQREDCIDRLELPEEAGSPDPRSAMMGIHSIDEQYQRINTYQLNPEIPENILQHYEVARNLYLYAFYYYRFYMVAQHHILVTLEYAIKELIGKKKIQKFGEKRKIGKNLKACMVFIIEKQLIKDEDFFVWNQIRENKALESYRMEKLNEMVDKNLETIELDYDSVDVDLYDFDYDYLSILEENFPKIRNEHAHGSTILHSQALLDFENVSTIINKVFERI